MFPVLTPIVWCDTLSFDLLPKLRKVIRCWESDSFSFSPNPSDGMVGLRQTDKVVFAADGAMAPELVCPKGHCVRL